MNLFFIYIFDIIIHNFEQYEHHIIKCDNVEIFEKRKKNNLIRSILILSSVKNIFLFYFEHLKLVQ